MLALLFLLLWQVIEWLIVCGLVKLVTLCFGWTFSWLIATGVWLAIKIIRFLFK